MILAPLKCTYIISLLRIKLFAIHLHPLRTNIFRVLGSGLKNELKQAFGKDVDKQNNSLLHFDVEYNSHIY